MKLMLAIAILLAPALATRAGEPQAEALKKEALAKALEGFAGTWEIVSSNPEGAAKNARRLVFRKDGTYAALGEAAPDGEAQELWAGTFELDPTATPKIWDHRSHETAKKGGDVLGIYELEGDRLKVACVVGQWKEKKWEGKPRPTGFKVPEVDVVLELRRVGTGK